MRSHGSAARDAPRHLRRPRRRRVPAVVRPLEHLQRVVPRARRDDLDERRAVRRVVVAQVERREARVGRGQGADDGVVAVVLPAAGRGQVEVVGLLVGGREPGGEHELPVGARVVQVELVRVVGDAVRLEAGFGACGRVVDEGEGRAGPGFGHGGVEEGDGAVGGAGDEGRVGAEAAFEVVCGELCLRVLGGGLAGAGAGRVGQVAGCG